MPQVNGNWNGMPAWPTTGWTPQGPTWQQYPSYSRYVPRPQQVLTGNHVPEVDGINGANAFPLGSNSAVLLLDKKDPYVYLKTTDDAGYPNVERYRVTPDPIEQRLSMVPTYPNTFGYTAGPNPFCQCNTGCFQGNL